MIDNISRNITEFLLSEKNINSKNKDVYQYGIELVISSVITFGIMILVGSLLSDYLNAVLFYLSLISLRHFTGGYHSKSYLKCNIVFVVVMIACLKTNAVIGVLSVRLYILIVMAICSLILIFVFSPIENINKKIDEKEKRRYRKLSVIMFLLHLAVFGMLNLLHVDSKIIIVADFAVAIAMIIGFYENRRRCKQDEKSKIDIS